METIIAFIIGLSGLITDSVEYKVYYGTNYEGATVTVHHDSHTHTCKVRGDGYAVFCCIDSDGTDI